MRKGAFLTLLLTGAVSAPAFAQTGVAAPAGQAAQPEVEEEALPDDELDAGTEIVVTGQRQRGAVLGDIPPDIQLSPRDIRSFGASNLAELLTQLAPQTRSTGGRGEGGPVILLNGQRISGFGEIRDLPPEAIERIDILPEEVALRYGYSADQRVVNFVLRPRFRAVTGEAEYGFATDGGRSAYEADLNFLRIGENGRVVFDAEYSGDTALLESERDLSGDLTDLRTLLPRSDQLALSLSLNRRVTDQIAATVTGRFNVTDSASLFGAPSAVLLVPGSSPFSPDGEAAQVPLQFRELGALGRDTETRTGNLSLSVNGNSQPWRWAFTGNYDRSRVETLTDTSTADITALQSRVSAGDPSLDPFGAIDPGLVRRGARDRAFSLNQYARAEMFANGPLFDLPAGDVSASFRIGGDLRRLSSTTQRGSAFAERDLGRDRVNAQVNVDVPVASRRRAVLEPLGNLSLNLNAAVEHLSDFGTLRTLGYGLNWSPIPAVTVIASMTDEDGAPSIQQLGDPVILTPNVRVFDFVRGETVDISRLEGGNAGLLADNRSVLRLGLNVRPLPDTNLSLSANYTRSRIDDPIASFPTATPEIEAAFPDRFTRDADGRLLRIDARPVNFQRSDREQLRWGFNLQLPVGPQPQGRGAAGGGRPPGAGGASTGGPRAGGPRGFGGGGFGRGGGGGGLQLALYHNWTLRDSVLIRDGVPELDFLGGSAVGNRGGRPEHEIELQGGIFRNGFGARVSANWQSGTFVRGVPGAGGSGSDLFFSDLATVNLRLFANLGQQRALRDQRWLRGTRVSLAVENLFGSRPDVRDGSGVTPVSYLPDYLDPLGRTLRLSIRKLFF